MANDFGFVAEKDFGFTPEVNFTPEPGAYRAPSDVDAEGLPAGLPASERRRLNLLSERAAAEAEGQKAEQDIADLEPQQRSLGFFADLPRHILNLPSYAADAVSRATGGAAIEPSFKPGQSLIPVEPAHPNDTGIQGGSEQLAAKFLSSLTTPDMLLAAPAAAESAAVRTLFGLGMTGNLPEQAARAGQVFGDINSTPAEKVIAAGEPIGAAALTGLLGVTPSAKAIPEVPDISDLAKIDRTVRNIAEPGTVRPQEQRAVGPIRHDAPAMFEAGEIPFQNMRRFGSYEVPPPDVLPQMGRIENVPILEEGRPKQELETRGKVSFGAEAPTLLRTSQIPKAQMEAIESAQAVGLNRSAQALKEVTDASTVRSDQGQLPKEGQAVEGGEKTGGNDVQQPTSGTPDEARPTEVPQEEVRTKVRTLKSTEEATAYGKSLKLADVPALEAAREQLVKEWKAGDVSAERPAYLAREALEAARGQEGELAKTGITKATEPERVAVQAPFEVEGEKSPGYVSIQSKGNERSGAPEAWRAAGHDIPDFSNLPTGTYTLEEAKALLEEEPKPVETPATETPKAAPKETPKAAPKFKMSFKEFLEAPREGKLLEELTKLPKAEKTAEQAKADQRYDAATAAIDKAGLSWIYDSPYGRSKSQIQANIRQLPKAKKALVDEYNRALNEKVSEQISGREARQKALYDKAVESGVIEDTTKPGVAGTGEQTTSSAPVLPTESVPDIVTRLEQVRDRFDASGDMGKTFSLPHPDAFKSVGKSIVYTALDLAIKAIKAGRTLADAMSVAMAHISSHARGFDPAKVQANLEHMVKTRTNPADLTDIYEIFQPEKEKVTLGQRVTQAAEAFRTGFSSKFRPLNKLAEDIAKAYGHAKALDIAGVFEQLKGSSGKAEADVYRFDKDVSDLVEGHEQDFNAYLFLRRSLDRMEQDARDAAAGKPVRRKVSTYTIPDLQAKLSTLEQKVGPKLPEFQRAADAYQAHLDQALQLQVDSGRMSPQSYNEIKNGNQFYAPFKLLKYIEESMRPEGSGRRVETQADYTKAMEGIEDPNVKLGELLPAARQNITLSRILAEKNQAMRELSDLAIYDLRGDFIRQLPKGAEVPEGMSVVTVLENGEPVQYAVNKNVADAVQAGGPVAQNILMQSAGTLFRAGATTFNLPFQVANVLADQPRAALVSKYGIKGVADLVQYPYDFWKAISSAIQGNVFGSKNTLFQDFLDSGAAGSTVQEYLTPEALTSRVQNPVLKGLSGVLDKAGDFATAIEQSSKIVGITRAMREHGVTSGVELAKQFPDAITEVRRFSGSPDFGRMGKWTDAYRLNLLYMFLNARIQGGVADIGRLAGRDGAKASSQTWLRVGAAVGIPTVMAYLYNHMPGNAEDYAKRPQQEKQNYWLIPKNKYITASNGEKIRDYWRIPKREIAQWFGNGIESFMDFARERDPKSFGQFVKSTAESLSPVNIQGKNFQEKIESIGGSLNPILKAPLEVATGRDLYRHKSIVPDAQKKATPEYQYTDRTSEVFKSLAKSMPDVAPEVFRSPLYLENMTRNFTAGLITQFIPGKPVEGRNAFENLPIMQRFQALPFTDSSEFEERIDKFEREAADTQLARFRAAQKIVDDHKGENASALIKSVIETPNITPLERKKLAERVIDVWTANKRGINSQERRILALPTSDRAQYIMDELKDKSPEEKAQIIREYSKKRILTKAVAEQMTR